VNQTPQTPTPTDTLANGPDDVVRVVAQGRRWVVVEKPHGLLSVPGRGEHKHDSVLVRVQAMFPDATGPMTVHRLDMETSGLLVFALSRPAHAKLSRQFMHRKVGKAYIAILDGEVVGDEGEVDLPLIVDWPNRPRHHVNFETGKPARTLWRVIDRQPGRARVEFRPETGRTHQLRIHAATPREQGGIGAPILGDTLYGDPESHPRMCLHAAHLAFWEPFQGEWLKFDSPPPF
jgi:tRNA pseudouridine32 synthase / 23S rRNA pseudouridine746 synthase